MTHKLGVRVPHTIEEASQVNKEMGTDFWEQAVLNKEMSHAKVAGKSHKENVPEEVGAGKTEKLVRFQEIKCHVVFDVEAESARKLGLWPKETGPKPLHWQNTQLVREAAVAKMLRIGEEGRVMNLVDLLAEVTMSE